ncbi:MAG: hypothetical protein JXA73_25085 [Acidobacteria bacterium]|nr:hypothetical protein [Acidobacteriota bacterium]
MAFTLLIDASELSPHIEEDNWAIVDCRFSLDDTERGYWDYLKSHIPRAISAPFEENLTPEGSFLSPEILRRRFGKLMKSVPPENVICYCGSGVTAAHNIIALAYAGFGTARLYAGSWSEWITDSARPIATGAV